ncbi:type II toxin-antitoxin system VapB family antitoxin [Zhihengliuella halotolerans]|uniref:VapB protein of antitoxin of type II toxin-antitoxin system n=1 Tax=Zhihengliuella halotolerans TaxID=370736 RepID=A0A4Q8AEY5_9MICC|nr:type II toxin-antitoxin system VapB family antitoxin [Zhihengliuella halotolerans]RZU62223.1 VapB protein of antitoxin of type II toxin-antitoxin system [Zhihengliuella halotolerans]
MAITSIDISGDLLRQARSLTGASSNREVVDLALRRLIAHKSKQQMVDAISQLADLPSGLHAPTIKPGQPDQHRDAQ